MENHTAARKYYNEHIQQFAAAPEISHILVENEEQASALLQQLQNGEDFTSLAAVNSKCPSHKDGGKQGRMPIFFYVPEFGQALAQLNQVDQVIGPVKSPFGYHLIRMDSERRDVTFEECGEMLEQLLPHLVEREENTV